jgi:hypothetical protein
MLESLEVELQSQFNNAMSVLGIDPTKSAGIYSESLCRIADIAKPNSSSGSCTLRCNSSPVVDPNRQSCITRRLQGKVNISPSGIGEGRVEDIEES